MAQPVPVVGDGEPAGLLGECFLALQGLELVGLGDLGGDHFEDPVREPAQRDRVVLGRAPDQVGLGVAAVLDRQRVDALHDHHRLLLRHLCRRPSRPGPARGRGPGRARAPGGAWRPVWSAGSGWPSSCSCRRRRLRAPRSSRSAWWAWRSSSSVIWCRSWARAVRLASVSAGRRVHSPRSATSCSSWVTAAIVDVTGCCPVSSNAVVIQGILASGTDSPGPGTGSDSGHVDKHFESFWSPRCRGLDKLDQRAARQLDHRRGGPPQPPPCATREQTATPRRTSPVAAPFHHADDPQPRGGLDTRSLALAARPPGRAPPQLPPHANTWSRSTAGGEALSSRSTGQWSAGQPRLVRNPTATLERRIVVPASPLQELCKRRLMDSPAPVARMLASFEAAKPLGRVQRQEHHRIASGHDFVTPPEHRAGQDP